MLESIKKATRMIIGLDNYSFSERLKTLNITTLYYRRKRQDLIQIFILVELIVLILTIFLSMTMVEHVGITKS